jgi:hypothetical protein
MEEWLPINGNEQYAISNLGNVKYTISGRLLKVYPPRLTTIKRIWPSQTHRIPNYFKKYINIPVNTPYGKRTRKYYVEDLIEAYNDAKILLQINSVPEVE